MSSEKMSSEKSLISETIKSEPQDDSDNMSTGSVILVLNPEKGIEVIDLNESDDMLVKESERLEQLEALIKKCPRDKYQEMLDKSSEIDSDSSDVDALPCEVIDPNESDDWLVKKSEQLEQLDSLNGECSKEMPDKSSEIDSNPPDVNDPLIDGLNYSSFITSSERSSTPKLGEILPFVSGRFDESSSQRANDAYNIHALLTYEPLMPKIFTASIEDYTRANLAMYSAFNSIVHPLEIFSIAQSFSRSPDETFVNLMSLLNYRANDFITASRRAGYKIFIRGHHILQSFGWTDPAHGDEVCSKCKRFKADMIDFNCGGYVVCEHCVHSFMVSNEVKCIKCNSELAFLYKQK